MIEKYKSEQLEAILGVSIKEVALKSDGSKDIYRYRKNNPKIYKYVLVGIYVEKKIKNINHLKKMTQWHRLVSLYVGMFVRGK